MHTDPYFIIFHVVSLAARALFEGIPIACWSACIRLLLAAFTGSASSFLDLNRFLADLDVGLYIFFWLVRIRGCVRRGYQPLLRGPEWFFDVRVRPDFYVGAGRKILHRYWMRMFIPFLLDIPLATAIFLSGRFAFLNWLVLGLCAFIHINHSFSVERAERQARAFAIPEGTQPAASIALSLKPRRLRDYANPKLEWAFALTSLFAFTLLARYYFAAPEHHDLRLIFAGPVFLLYAELGLLFVKQLVLAWRNPIPAAQASAHIAAREETRKYYLAVCDFYRAALAASLLFWPIQLTVPPADRTVLVVSWLASWLLISVVATVWVEIKRKQLLALSLRTCPEKLPDFLHQSEIARWPVCYQPSAPMLILKGAHGYSLNLANRLTHLGAAYVAGLVALLALLPRGH